jgi:Iron-dependent Transcriptional regulator
MYGYKGRRANAFTRVGGGVRVYPFGDGKRKTRPMKLELSSEGRYALRALVYLARDAGSGELVTADRISTEAVVPRSLLARVMAKLARAGLVETSEGRGEGPASPDSPKTSASAMPWRAWRDRSRSRTASCSSVPAARAPLRPARRLGRGPERHPRTPRQADTRRLLLPGPALPPVTLATRKPAQTLDDPPRPRHTATNVVIV